MHLKSMIVAASRRHSLVAAHGAQSTGPVVLKAAYLFDSKSGQLTQGGTVVVEGDKIVSIGGSGAGERPGDRSRRRDAAAGLHRRAHAPRRPVRRRTSTRRSTTQMLRFPVEQAHTAALYAKRTLEAGFTTVRNVGAADFVDIGLRNAINNGVIVGPRMITAAHSIGSTGGHCDSSPFPPEVVKPLGPLEGVCNGAGRMPRGRALSDEVGRGRDQDLRIRRRAVGIRSGRRAAAHAGRAGRDHVGSARLEAQGRGTFARRPGGEAGRRSRRRFDRARQLPDGSDAALDEAEGRLPRADAHGRVLDRARGGDLSAGDRRRRRARRRRRTARC